MTHARLHVLLGGGGVGKTTLAAAYALALAKRGGRVGLLGIDPSQRLQDALGLGLADLDAQVPGADALRAAIVHPHQAIDRWVRQSCRNDADLARLERNPFFAALGDRLATATDILAAARMAEWAAQDPALTDLVVDTAPGVAAMDFLRSPRHMEALLRGPLVRLLRSAARVGQGRFAGLRFGVRRLFDLLGRLAGTNMATDLADFFALAHAPLEQMLVRVEGAERWLRAADTELLIVTSPRDTAAGAAQELCSILSEEGLSLRALVVNRTWPSAMEDELAALEIPAAAAPFVAYARAQLRAQAGVRAAALTLTPAVVTLAACPGLEYEQRQTLCVLGEALLLGLDACTKQAQAPG